MSNIIKYITINSDRWKEYGDLLQRSYKEFPESFLISYEEEKNLPDLEGRYRQYLQDPNALTLFAELDGKLIGAVVAYFFPEKIKDSISDIIFLYVIPEHHRKGIAQQLMDVIFDRLKERQIKYVKVGVYKDNIQACKFYRKSGFVDSGIIKNESFKFEKYYDQIVLEKKLLK
jgi:ribosomal protein S18 acetylase RimI-like enzyme